MIETKDPAHLRLSSSTTYAKIENLYSTIKQMFENGSQQSHMTLNLQFIVSQMMQVSDGAPEDFGSAHLKLKKLISRYAKTFYLNHRNKGFYLIENYIGFVYCLMTLMSKSLVFSSAVYNILQNLSFLDGARLLQMREKALRHLLNDDKLERMEFLFLSEMFQPDEESTRAFKPFSHSSPLFSKPGFLGLEKKVNIKGEIADKFLAQLPENVERIILKPTPFEGNVANYYNELLNKLPREGYSKTQDLIEMNTIPSRYYIKKMENFSLPDSSNLAYIKEMGQNYAAKLKMEAESKPNFATPVTARYANTNPCALLNTPDFNYQSPDPSSNKFTTPNDREVFGSPSDFDGNEFKTPEITRKVPKGKSLENAMFSKIHLTPQKKQKKGGSGKGAWWEEEEEDNERYIIQSRKDNICTPKRCRKYKLPTPLRKKENTLKPINDDFSFEFDSCNFPPKKEPNKKYKR